MVLMIDSPPATGVSSKNLSAHPASSLKGLPFFVDNKAELLHAY